MAPHPTLRPATFVDADDLAQIRREAIVGLASDVLGHAQAKDWADSSTRARIERAIHRHQTWVAQVDGAVVGWVEVCEEHIRGLYVAPAWSQQRIGSALMTMAEALIRSAGFPLVALDASPNAVGFYLHRGYRSDGPATEDGALPLCKRLGEGPAR